MKLEEEIHQKNFRNEYQKLAVNLFFTHGWLANNFSNILKQFDLTINQFNVLRILRGQHPNSASVNLLKERMLDKMSDASRLVERLRTKGYVERSICPNDRRKVDVLITKAGLEVLYKCDKIELEFDKQLHNLNSTEAKILNDLLDKLRN